jgi:hypothetical protein
MRIDRGAPWIDRRALWIDREAPWMREMMDTAIAAIPLWYQPKGGRDEWKGGFP